MVEEKKSNLEPLEESDLSMKEKFVGGKAESALEISSGETEPVGVENVPNSEKSLEKPERKEGRAESESAYSKILAKVSPKNISIHGDVDEDAQIANREKDLDGKINNLVNLAQLKGIPHAVKVARHLEDNYILDELHDRLLGEELRKALVSKGLIREI